LVRPLRRSRQLRRRPGHRTFHHATCGVGRLLVARRRPLPAPC
jgi:hypothetical protein